MEIEDEDKDLFDAVSAAIDGDTPPHKEDQADDEEDTESSADGDDAASDDGEDDEGSSLGDGAGEEGTEPGSEESDDGEEAAAGDDKSADEDEGAVDKAGKSDVDDDAKKKAADDTGDDKGKGADAAAEPDHVNDPIPDGTNDRTAKRIQGLIATVKEKSAIEEQYNEFVEGITQTGATPEQYGAAMGFLRHWNSTDPEQKRNALKFARQVTREIALELGEGSDLVDLKAHDDLLADIEAGTLSEDRAREIAATREAKKLKDDKAKQDNDAVESQQQTRNLVAEGQEALNSFEKSLMSDADYVRLRPMFVNTLRATLRSGQVHPSNWGAVAADTFAALKAANPAPKPKPNNNNRQPLRAKQGAGGGSNNTKPEAGSAVDAVNEALKGL